MSPSRSLTVNNTKLLIFLDFFKILVQKIQSTEKPQFSHSFFFYRQRQIRFNCDFFYESKPEIKVAATKDSAERFVTKLSVNLNPQLESILCLKTSCGAVKM